MTTPPTLHLDASAPDFASQLVLLDEYEREMARKRWVREQVALEMEITAAMVAARDSDRASSGGDS